MSNIPVGLQLYTLREETKDDFVGTLKKVAEMGYKAVEFAGYGGLDAKEMKNVLDGLGLSAPSAHIGIHLLESDLQKEIDYALEAGIKYLVCPHLNANARLHGEENFKQTMESFRNIGEACSKHGLTFAYHNHAFEFEQIDGNYILDRMYEEVPADFMRAELDLYWVKKAGLDPKQYLQQYKGRCDLIHVKDMTDDERGFFAEVGSGIIDFKSIFDIAPEVGVQYYIVEQDKSERSPLESVKMSIEYLKSIGIA